MCGGDVVSGIGSLITGGLAAVGLGSLFNDDDSGGSSTPAVYSPPAVEAPISAPVGAVADELKQEDDLSTDEEKKKRKKGRDTLRNDRTNTTGTDSTAASGINILG